MIKRHIYFGMSVVLALCGCAGPRGAGLPVPRPLGSDIPSFHAASDAVDETASAEAIERQDTITLPQALALALMRNPELEAFSHEVRAAEARTVQARLCPNPEIEVAVDSFDRGGAGFDAADSSVVLGQLIELGGKRRWRARVAEAQGELAGWDYEAKRLDVFTRTAQRFTEMLAAQLRHELAVSAVALAEQTSHAVGERVKAGKEPPVQAAKAVAELEMTRLAALEAENSLVVSRKKLAVMWGTEEPHFQKVVGDLDSVLDALPAVETLRLRLSSNPDLARGDVELKLRQAALASEKSARAPDLEATVGLQHFEEDGTDALAFGVGFPLPLFDRNQGNIAAAKHEIAKKQAEQRAAETELATELAEIHARLMSAHRRALTLRSKVVPAMEETFAAAHNGYGQGKFGFLDVLDAQRGLFIVRGDLLDALSDYHIALTDIQRITGTSIEELLRMKPEEKQ
jgi:cobalt-zinc-cadmium efflux system outer membrane protein